MMQGPSARAIDQEEEPQDLDGIGARASVQKAKRTLAASPAEQRPQKKAKPSGLSLPLPRRLGQHATHVDEDDEEILATKEETEPEREAEKAPEVPATVTELQSKATKETSYPALASESKERKKAKLLLELKELEIEKKEVSIRKQLMELEEEV